MTTRIKALALIALVPFLSGASCTKIKAKSAFKDGIKLLLNGTALSAQLDLLQSSTVAALTPPGGLLPDTVYTVSISGVKDIAGNLMSGTFTSSFKTIDTIAPTVSSLTYTGDLIKNNILPITAVGDPDTASVDFFADGVLMFTDSTSPFAYSMPLTKEGPVTVKAVARDLAGNRNPNIPWARELSFTVVADTPPATSITSPAEGSQVSTNASVTVNVTSTDDLLAKEITLTAVMNGQTLLSQTKTSATGKTFSTTFSFTVPLTAAPGSSIVITAAAKDSGGQASAIAQRTLAVKDGTVPAIASITSPGQTAKYRPGEQNAQASVTATDNIGVTSITCTASGAATGSRTFTIEPAATTTTQTFVFPVSPSATPYQNMTVTCTAKDAAPNTSPAGTLTMQVADIVPPAVTGANRTDGETNVPAKPTISVTFSEALLASTVTGTTVTLTIEGGMPVAGSVTLTNSSKTVNFTPTQNLTKAARFRFSVGTAVTDEAGNGLTTEYAFSFTTDGTPPSVVGTSPANNATNIQARPVVSATFDEPFLASTVNAASVKLVADDGAAVAGTASLGNNGKTVSFTLSQDLVKATTYRLVLTSAVTDEIGNGQSGAPVLSFTTDDTPPAIATVTPADGAQNVALGIAVRNQPRSRAEISLALVCG